MEKNYISVNDYCKKVFGEKVYKLALSASTNCPNRDGTCGVGGCSFCSAGGSGDFAQKAYLPIEQQIANAKLLLKNKVENIKYIAYFQSFTGTHGNLEYLEKVYTQAIMHKDIVAISIATRPDCLGDKAMEMLTRLSKIKPLWVELGLQTINENTAKNFNRGYALDVYESAIKKLKNINAHIITHIILGLPNETKSDMIETCKYVSDKTDGIKLQLLHVLKGTRLEKNYLNNEFKTLEADEYYNLIADILDILPKDMIIHRLTGDGAKKDLIAPLWSGNKKRVLNDLNKILKYRNCR